MLPSRNSSIEVIIEPNNTVSKANLIYCSWGFLESLTHFKTIKTRQITAGIPIRKLSPIIPKSTHQNPSVLATLVTLFPYLVSLKGKPPPKNLSPG